MTKVIGTVLLALTLFTASGCRSSTEYGECVGVQDVDDAKREHPNLEYKLSVRNAVLGVIFVESVFAPLIWVLADFECPVSKLPPKL